ncbi:MAG: hypothetical protein HN742_39830 [Lentisphaerae bacterium]|jgi:hypothetical protein|nr:hypothetical protein [Lentisphaerota bacterium]MBT4814226.1 hypothetical protein [Lentisphaerota bacterium]MBT5611247.1 hypothetical protein [Lentisphaerota bacterium]MBT7057862.1 hypothetical protein [Lentisphaerota bacterium]MBT7848086.1 hypothetical protein [Lentisphaerota bacterium]
METEVDLASSSYRRDSAEPGPQSGRWFWLLWLLIGLVYVLLRIGPLDIPLDRDEGLFGYIGQTVLRGGLPYRDAIEHKPPLVFYINALCFLVLPPTPTGVHLFLHAYNFLTLLVLYRIAKAYTSCERAALWVAFVFAVFSSTPAIQGFTASTEMFLLLPFALSLLCAVKSVKNRHWRHVFLSGFFGALTFWTKQTAALMLLYVVAHIALPRVSAAESRREAFIVVLRAAGLWSGGFLLVSAVIFGYFSYCGIQQEFVYWSFIHNLLYSKGLDRSETVSRYAGFALDILREGPLLIGVAVGSSLWLSLRQNTRRYMGIGLLPVSLAAAVPGIVFPHYFAQIAPAVALAGGFGVAEILVKVRDRKKRPLCLLVCLLAILLPPLLACPSYYRGNSPDGFSREFFGGCPFPESLDIAELLTDALPPDEGIFILGSEPQILLYTERPSVTSFIMMYPLMSPRFPRYREFQERTWEEVQEAKPSCIVVIGLQSSLLLDTQGDLRMLDQIGALLDDQYQVNAVGTLDTPKGKLFARNEMPEFDEFIKGDQFPIHVFRLRAPQPGDTPEGRE